MPENESLRARPSGLLRILRSREGAAISLGVAIGAGIFRTPGDVAGFLSSPAAIVGVWALGGFLVLLDAAVLAELAAARPRAGGHYVYIKDAYGRRMAFLYGWTAAFLTWPASVAALGAAAFEFARRLGLPPWPIALTVVLLPAILHAAGLRVGAYVQDALSYGKALVIAAVAIAAIVAVASGAVASGAGGHGADSAMPLPTAPLAPFALVGLGLALQQVLWTYDGYADAIFVAEELKDPGRALPRALLGSVLVLTLLYVTVNLAFLACLTPAEMAASKLVAADAVGRLGGPLATRAIEVIALVTVLGASSATLLSGPRISYAMARDGLLFPVFARLLRGTPIVGLAVMTAAALAYLMLDTWNQILSLTIFVVWIFVTFTTVALFVFRRREPASSRPFRVPFYPALPLLLLAVAAAILADLLLHSFWIVAQGLGVMLLGLVAYEVWTFLARRAARSGDGV